MGDGVSIVRARLRAALIRRPPPRHLRSRHDGAVRRTDRRAPAAHLLLGSGALLIAVALPAAVLGLRPVPVGAAPPRVDTTALAHPAFGGSPPADVSVRVIAPRAEVSSAAPARPPALSCRAPAAASPRTPTRVSVPAVGIDACVSGLGLRDDGSMRVPAKPQQVGWYNRGPRPGQQGPALLVGHVDSTDGPAAFFALRRVERGDVVHVRDKRGRTTTFVVYRISRYAKNEFPTDQVFRGVARPELRLVTCSGSFNPLTRHYSHNIVVYARLSTGVRG